MFPPQMRPSICITWVRYAEYKTFLVISWEHRDEMMELAQVIFHVRAFVTVPTWIIYQHCRGYRCFINIKHDTLADLGSAPEPDLKFSILQLVLILTSDRTSIILLTAPSWSYMCIRIQVSMGNRDEAEVFVANEHYHLTETTHLCCYWWGRCINSVALNVWNGEWSPRTKPA